MPRSPSLPPMRLVDESEGQPITRRDVSVAWVAAGAALTLMGLGWKFVAAPIASLDTRVAVIEQKLSDHFGEDAKADKRLDADETRIATIEKDIKADDAEPEHVQ